MAGLAPRSSQSDGDSQPPSPMGGPTASALDLTGAEITGHVEEEEDTPATHDAGLGKRPSRDAPAIVLPNQDAQYITHIALDIGGSLVKLLYFSQDVEGGHGDEGEAGSAAHGDSAPGSSSDGGSCSEALICAGGRHAAAGMGSAAPGAAKDVPDGSSGSQKGGKLHFVKFETCSMEQCLDFIEAKGLHRYWHSGGNNGLMRVKATGGGAYKFAEVFRQRLGLILEKEDEMHCLVDGCNFLCRAIRAEAFTYENHVTQFVATNVTPLLVCVCDPSTRR